MERPAFEDRYGPFARRASRLLRNVRWRLKGALGTTRHILVETRWRLGDEIMAIPIYEGLRNIFPKSHITALCNFPELLEGNPFVDAINVETGPVDRYVMLRSDARSINRLEHYASLAGIPTPRSRPRLFYNDWSDPWLERNGRPTVAFASGASWNTKRWPVEYWRRLCEEVADVGIGVVELGQGDERIGVGLDLVDKTTVREAACVLRAANLLVCCDSGLMHLALAVGTPVLALFGPTEPSILVCDEPGFYVIRSDVRCGGCWNVSLEMTEPGVCPRGCPTCLDSIAPEIVLKCLFDLLAEPTSARH